MGSHLTRSIGWTRVEPSHNQAHPAGARDTVFKVLTPTAARGEKGKGNLKYCPAGGHEPLTFLGLTPDHLNFVVLRVQESA